MKHTSEDAAQILQALIRCPSVTPKDEGALGTLETLLTTAGFTCHRLVFKQEGTADIDNLFARIGNTSPHLCFAGHTDVVPVGDEKDWSHPPFGAEIHNGQIYGRGATDMKGSVAAFAAAAIDYVKEQGTDKGSISFLITGDEDEPLEQFGPALEWGGADHRQAARIGGRQSADFGGTRRRNGEVY